MAEYDIVIAGGGTVAGVIAGRLSRAAPHLKILILEAGPHTLDNLAHIQPARYLSHLAPTSTTVRFYQGRTSEDTGKRQVVVPAGACVGGGSSVNFCMYTRAAASDYDDWKSKFGNEGWDSQALIPLLKKTESYQLPDRANPRDTHGYEGPLKVSYGGMFTNVGKEFLDVAAKHDPSRSLIADASSLHDIDGFVRWQKWIGLGTGKRSDVAHHFIYNQKHNKNLEVRVGCVVHRILFEGTRAVGVEYRPDIPPEREDETLAVYASKLVVVCCGALGTPQVLERSGIGRHDVLDTVGVDQRVNLPGVGENYQDHQALFPPYLASEDSETLDGIIRNKAGDFDAWNQLWKDEGTGLMAHNGIDAAAKLRPNPVELVALGPDFKPRWDEYFKDAPDKPVMLVGMVSSFVGDFSTVPDRKYMSGAMYIQYPSSTGSVHITSLDPKSNPQFDPGYLKTKDDLAVLKWGYKYMHEIFRRLPSYRGEWPSAHPQCPPGSVAEAKGRAGPVDLDAPNIDWSENDEALENYIRANVATAWHSLGTCAMKPREQGGVVDSRLNVYGVENLKCADMSICPSNVSANTYSTALVIGEKAAVIIAAELGITGVTASPL